MKKESERVYDDCAWKTPPVIKVLRVVLLILAVLAIIFFVYCGRYYHADERAEAALEPDGAVAVTQTGYGWLFDGPADDTALIFYPGAKVETEAYAPFLRLLAEQGMDVCLVDMPFHLAFFGIGRADDVMEEQNYEHWYIGGHSLGGAMAAVYAADNGSKLDGLILCAAYPTKELDDDLTELVLYGSEDQVLHTEKVEEGRQYAPEDYTETVIEGGNHAQFGSYGVQKGDGEAVIPAEEQWEQAVQAILAVLEE